MLMPGEMSRTPLAIRRGLVGRVIWVCEASYRLRWTRQERADDRPNYGRQHQDSELFANHGTLHGLPVLPLLATRIYRPSRTIRSHSGSGKLTSDVGNRVGVPARRDDRMTAPSNAIHF